MKRIIHVDVQEWILRPGWMKRDLTNQCLTHVFFEKIYSISVELLRFV